jgi:hypothetical protein
MSWHRESTDAGSTLPEVVLAAGLLVVALGMLGGTVLVPLAALARTATIDDRQVALELAGDTVVRIALSARPGLEASPVLSAERDRIVLRVGDLREARTVVLLLREGSLTVEIPDGPLDPTPASTPSSPSPVPGPAAGVVISGIDSDASSFTVRSSEGIDLTFGPSAGGTAGVLGSPLDVAHVQLILVDPIDQDGSPGRRVERNVHLRLRLPLATAAQP